MGFWRRFLLIMYFLQCSSSTVEWDDYGYVLFCPCMGRFGNQVAHFLGAMQFAKDLNRTLTLPPFRTYVRQRNVPFKDWFKHEVINNYHKSLPLEEFIEVFGDSHWPSNDRTGYCYRSTDPNSTDCRMKEGNPFGPFWNELGVNFNKSTFTQLSYDTSHETVINRWKLNFPPSHHPVLAFKGAPASFPVLKRNRHLQKYLVWSDTLMTGALEYITHAMDNDSFIAVHLRIGSDWKKACEHATGRRSYMESLMCLEDQPEDSVITEDVCYPTNNRIISDIKHIVHKTGIKKVFIGSDSKPPLTIIREELGDTISVYHMNPEGPQLDLVIFELADHFIANCVSSLSAIAVRARNIKQKPTSFWGMHQTMEQHDEL